MPHVLRLPQIDLASVLAEQNSHIELRTHIYENSTRNFLKALITYKNRAIATISDRRKHQAMEKKKMAERINLVEAETNQCKLREIELVAGAPIVPGRSSTHDTQTLSGRTKKGRMQNCRLLRSTVS